MSSEMITLALIWELTRRDMIEYWKINLKSIASVIKDLNKIKLQQDGNRDMDSRNI